jgi:hypothetical protein
MHLAETRRGLLWQRTAPYLGVACLALLAFAGTRGLRADLAPLIQREGAARPTTAWLAVPGARGLLVAAGSLAVRGARFTSGHPVFTSAQASGSLTAAWRVRGLTVWPASPRARGALAIPAFLVAIRLAQCH